MAKAILKEKVSDPGPSWLSCLNLTKYLSPQLKLSIFNILLLQILTTYGVLMRLKIGGSFANPLSIPIF